MANIIGLKQQQAALREINGILKDITIANEFLAAQNPSDEYSITFTGEDGKKRTTLLKRPKAEIDELIVKFKNDQKDYVQRLAQENKIALDPEDEVVLGIRQAAAQGE